jgi:hypothetical protein
LQPLQEAFHSLCEQGVLGHPGAVGGTVVDSQRRQARRQHGEFIAAQDQARAGLQQFAIGGQVEGCRQA